MESDFNIVKYQIINAYYETDTKWTIEECLEFFRYYYRLYRQTFNKDHPKLSNDTIKKIIERLDHIVIIGDCCPLFPQDYPQIIQQYFEQPFKNCNYSLAHFTAGTIRKKLYLPNLK